MGPVYLKLPNTQDEWKNIADQYMRQRGFPHCIGSIDGKHIRVVKPDSSGSIYYNYKHFFSLILLAVCDCNYKFLYVQIGSAGSESDGGVFASSELYQRLTDENLDLPPPENLGNWGPVPFFIIGDAAFGLGKHILRPYAGTFLTPEEDNFNHRLSSARMSIEQSFGILALRFRFLLSAIYADPDKVTRYVLAACVLHNFLRDSKDLETDDIDHLPVLEPAFSSQRALPHNRSHQPRDIIKNYLCE